MLKKKIVKGKFLALLIASLTISMVIFVLPVNAAVISNCKCKSSDAKISETSITNGVIYKSNKVRFSFANNEISGITVIDLDGNGKPLGDPWACFAVCLGGIQLSAECMAAVAGCIPAPLPINPACWAAVVACGVAIGLLLACITECWPDGGGGGCFLSGSQVLMADGTHKNIESIQVGDVVASMNLTDYSYTDGVVTEVFHHNENEMGDYYLIINGRLRVTPNHLLLMENYTWKNAGDLKTGDILFSLHGSEYVYSIVRVYDSVPVYHIKVEPDEVYFVDGFEVGGKPGIPSSSSHSHPFLKNVAILQKEHMLQAIVQKSEGR
ncbi:MAG: hypothetical protein DRN24_05725 [Thermoplasmata archaeon]|nr:MAG: hypothetical protein DRN24_05725 [Thermoplasmata archaeon]